MNAPISGANVAGVSHVWSGASAPMSPTQKMSNLFDQIDPSGTGSVTQSQFAQAFRTLNPPSTFQSAGADAVWSKLDPNGTGSVSKQDFITGMTAMMKQLRGHHHQHGASAAGAQTVANSTSLLDALGDSTATTAAGGTAADGVGSIIDLLA